MRIDQAVNHEDLHQMAKRKLPKVMFDYIEGGVEDERGLARNAAAFQKHNLLPRYLVDVSKRDQSQTIFGRTYASPFGISPTGGAGLFRHHADLMLAEAARDANIPYIMSGASNDAIEAAAKIAPNNHWYQLYAARKPEINADLPLDHFLPRSYIRDERLRLGAYRELAAAEDEGELEAVLRSLRDRYGPPPAQLANLVYSLQVKLKGQQLGLRALTADGRDIVIRVDPDRLLDVEELKRRFSGRLIVRPNRLLFRRQGDGWK